MANLKDLIVNGASRFIGKVFINDSSIGTINGSTVGQNPKFTGTNTTYSAGTGLTASGTTINHAASITAASVGPSADISGSTVAVPYITYNATGHITAASTKKYTVSSLAASAITSGTFATARIPSLPASIITSGTLGTAILPTVPIAKGGTGATTAAAARTSLGLGSAAVASTSASVGNNTNLPTGSAIQTYVTGLGYEANQNAFSNIVVGSSTVAADAKTDTLTLAGAGSITLSANTSTDTITITGANTTYGNATTAAAGLMSAADKQALGKWNDVTFSHTIATNVNEEIYIPYCSSTAATSANLYRAKTTPSMYAIPRYNNEAQLISTTPTTSTSSSVVATTQFVHNLITASGGGGSSSNRVTLFTGDSTGNVTLSSSAANYDLLEIFYEGYNGANPRTMKILNPNGRTITLNTIETAGSDGMRIRVARYTISGTSITSESSWSGYYLFALNGSFTNTLGTNVIHITRVDGIIDSTIESGMGDAY